MRHAGSEAGSYGDRIHVMRSPIRLDSLTPGTVISGLAATGPVEILAVEMHGSAAATVTWKDGDGRPDRKVIYAEMLAALRVVEAGRRWAFNADGDDFLLASEARRLRLAYLFDSMLAVNSSAVEPLPHQIRAVYEEMLPRQPLRFLLADDPGAGKTIMAGLLIKELILRGDLQRCLVVAPGALVEQWQEELGEKFGIELPRRRLDLALVVAGLREPDDRHELRRFVRRRLREGRHRVRRPRRLRRGGQERHGRAARL